MKIRRPCLRALCGALLWLAGCGEPMTADIPSELVDFVAAPQNPVLASPGPGRWDSNMRERGWIRREGDRWRLWYTGYNGAAAAERCALGLAVSSDGVAWRRYADEPLHAAHWVEDVMIRKDGDTYSLFSESEDQQSHLLTSTDGLRWTWAGRLDVRTRDGAPVAPLPFGTPTVFKEGDTYYLFYERQDDGIWLAASRDLRVFINVRDEPVLPLGPGASDSMQVALNQVIKYGGRYYAYYNGQGQHLGWTTNIATSTDLVRWQKYLHNPLFPPQDDVNSAILVDDGERFRLYAMHTAVRLFYSRAAPPRPAGHDPRENPFQ